MTDRHDQDPPSKLDALLRELEEQFTGSTTLKKNQTSSVYKKITAFSQSQIIGGLTLVLLVIGAAVGVFLGSSNQEIRQRAAEEPYSCTNPSGECSGQKVGGSCNSGAFQSVCKGKADGSCVCQTACELSGVVSAKCISGTGCGQFGAVGGDFYCPDGQSCCALNVHVSPTATPIVNTIPHCSIAPTCRGYCLAIVALQTGGICEYNGQQISANYCNTLRECNLPSCPGQPLGSYCSTTSDCRVGTVAKPGGCETTNNFSCCPGTASPTNAVTVEPTQIIVLPTSDPGNAQPTLPPLTNPTLRPTNTLTPRPTNTSVPTTPGQPTNTSVPLPTQTHTPIPTNTPILPTNTFTPRPTNTSVPTTPGQPTNTPLPLPTETPSPTTVLAELPPVVSYSPTPFIFGANNPTSTAQPTSTTTVANTATPQLALQQSKTSAQTPALPHAGNANQNAQLILGAISVAVLIGAVALLFFL